MQRDVAVADGAVAATVVASPQPSGLGALFVHGLGSDRRTNVERARALTEAAMAADSRLETLGKLFLAGTAALDEAIKSFTDRTGHAFQTGGDALAYLRQRGVLDAEAGTMTITEATRIGDDFRLAGIIEVEPLADLVATFLDTLDIHYDLFPPLSPDQPGPDRAAPVPSFPYGPADDHPRDSASQPAGLDCAPQPCWSQPHG